MKAIFQMIAVMEEQYDYTNGDKYIGDWAYGKQNGRDYTKSNREKYEGYFSNGIFSQ